MWLAQLLLLGALPVEITVEVVPGPDPCALGASVPEALRRMFPGIAVVTAGQTGAIAETRRLTLRLQPVEGGVHLELGDALVRDLPSAPDACAATADGIALVVERYLRDLGYEPTPAPLPDIATSTRARTATAAVVRPEPPVWTLALEGGGVVGATSAGRFELGPVLRARFGAGRYLELMGELGYHELGGLDVTRGTRVVGSIRARSLHALAGIAGCLPIGGSLRLCVSARSGVEWLGARGAAVGPTLPAAPTSDGVVQSMIAADLSAQVLLTSRLGLSFWGGALFRPSEAEFGIDGATPSYVVSHVALSFGGAVRVTIF